MRLVINKHTIKSGESPYLIMGKDNQMTFESDNREQRFVVRKHFVSPANGINAKRCYTVTCFVWEKDGWLQTEELIFDNIEFIYNKIRQLASFTKAAEELKNIHKQKK